MFVKAKNYENAIQKVKIPLGLEFGLEKEEEAYIELKELPTFEVLNLRSAYSKGEAEVMKFFHDVLPAITVDHNFWETEEKKMDAEALSDLIFERIEASTKVMSAYSDASFFSPRKKSEER